MSKSLLKAVVLVVFFSVLTRTIGFLFRIYLSRELGAELLGVYHAGFSVFMVLIVLVSSGIPLAVSKFTAVYRVNNNKKAEYGIVSASLVVGIIVSAIICLLIIVFKNSIACMFTDSRTINILIALLPAVIASAVYSSFRGALWGAQDYFNTGWTELAEQIARVVVFAVFAHIFIQFNGAINASLAMSVACCFSALLATIIYFKGKRKLVSPKNHYKILLKSSIPITGVRTASSLIQPIIAVLFPFMLLLAGYTNEQAMSMYGVAMGMTFPLLFLPSTIVGALSFTLIPELSTALAKQQNDVVKERITSSILFSMLVSSVFIPFYIGAGEGIGAFLYDNTTSGYYLARASIIMIPLGMSNITSSILNTYNLETKSFINNIIGGVVLLICVVLLSGRMGVGSLILGFGLCMTITTILNLRMIKKKTNYSLLSNKNMICLLLFLIPSTLLAKYSYNLTIMIFDNMFSLMVSGSVSIISYLLLCWIFRVVDLSFFIQKVNFRKRKSSVNT